MTGINKRSDRVHGNKAWARNIEQKTVRAVLKLPACFARITVENAQKIKEMKKTS